MSAIGPKQTWAVAPHMSAYGGKADTAYLAVPSHLWPDNGPARPAHPASRCVGVSLVKRSPECSPRCKRACRDHPGHRPKSFI